MRMLRKKKLSTENNLSANKALSSLRLLHITVEAGRVSEVEDHDISDLLTNLMHLCKRERKDFDLLLSAARDNFVGERNFKCPACGVRYCIEHAGCTETHCDQCIPLF